MLASGQGLAVDLSTGPLLVGVVVFLPTMIGTAISVARLEPKARWHSLGIGVIVSVLIAGVSVDLFGIEPAIIAGTAGVLGGGIFGAIIGAAVRYLRRRRAGDAA
ncbi:MAG: hypothetical protein ACI9U2_005013 [Bradymonadia bacterium]|jgi:hypothetical protein